MKFYFYLLIPSNLLVECLGAGQVMKMSNFNIVIVIGTLPCQKTFAEWRFNQQWKKILFCLHFGQITGRLLYLWEILWGDCANIFLSFTERL